MDGVSGQIQYGSAGPLTAPPTRGRRIGLRRLAALTGASLLLAIFVIGTPLKIPAATILVAFGGAWISLVLAMTLPSESEAAGRELIRRLAQFRHEVNAIGDEPSRSTLERLIDRAGELRLPADTIADELAQLRACIEAIDLKAALARGELPRADAPVAIASGDICHFVCAVRFGRRRADQVGHLVLSSSALQFHGALDVNARWSEVVNVRRNGREVIVAPHASSRMLRFCCHSYAEAARAGVIAAHLASIAHIAGKPVSAEFHASA
jgi:hypothetical protein